MLVKKLNIFLSIVIVALLAACAAPAAQPTEPAASGGDGTITNRAHYEVRRSVADNAAGCDD